MSEDQIERAVERRIDALDARFLRGELSQADYDRALRAVDAWAAAQYRHSLAGV